MRGLPARAFSDYQWAAMRENMRQFKGEEYKRGRSFVIAVADRGVLERHLNCRTETLPGFSRSEGVIVTRPNEHLELFIDPTSRRHRDMHLAFLENIAVKLPVGELRRHQSDHAFPVSAVDPSVGLVKAQLIPQAANSSFGAGVERLRKNRKGQIEFDGLVRGTLLDLMKAQGFRMIGPDLEENLQVTVEMLIGSGLAPARDRAALLECVDDAMVDIIGDS